MGSQERITVFREREPAAINNRTPAPKLLTLGLEWKMEVDLDRQLHFPEELCSITLLPDVVLWSLATFLIELTVP